MRRVAVANATRCDPPLDTGEGATIVANAWRSEVQGFAKLPHAVLDSDAFRALPDAGKVAILALCRNHNGANNGRIALTRTDVVRWRLAKRSRRAGFDATQAGGFIAYKASGTTACTGPIEQIEMIRWS